MMEGHDRHRPIRLIRDQVATHLADRSGTWLASFAELVATAGDNGVPIGTLQAYVTSLLGPSAQGEVHEDDAREALIDALVGRSASITPEDPGRSS
ncbi:MAG: hypothetical protein QOG15_308 [Solirubrobacteraceae bacterium]|jgi:hypothetical protein|nr:hypothetical protein [Solirubrobacteraceae bacterium]